MAFATWVDGRNVVVVNGAAGEAYDNISWPLALTNETLAYAARIGDRQYCVIDGARSRAYREVHPPVAHGRDVAYAASDGAGWFVVRGGREGPKFDWVGHLRLGKRFAYAAERAGKFHVVVDGEIGPAWDRVTAPAPDDPVAYGAQRDGAWFLVHGNREIREDGPIVEVYAAHGRAGCVRGEGWVGWPTFTADGRFVRFASRGKTKRLLVGDRQIELGEWTVWDPVIEGNRIGFGARVGRRLYWKELEIGGER